MTSQATETMSHVPQHPRSVMRSVRGCARLLAGLALIVVAPVWLGIAVSVDATHTVLWPTWYVWVATLAGVGLWVRGWMLRGLARESVARPSRNGMRSRSATWRSSAPFFHSSWPGATTAVWPRASRPLGPSARTCVLVLPLRLRFRSSRR